MRERMDTGERIALGIFGLITAAATIPVSAVFPPAAPYVAALGAGSVLAAITGDQQDVNIGFRVTASAIHQTESRYEAISTQRTTNLRNQAMQQWIDGNMGQIQNELSEVASKTKAEDYSISSGQYVSSAQQPNNPAPLLKGAKEPKQDNHTSKPKTTNKMHKSQKKSYTTPDTNQTNTDTAIDQPKKDPVKELAKELMSEFSGDIQLQTGITDLLNNPKLSNSDTRRAHELLIEMAESRDLQKLTDFKEALRTFYFKNKMRNGESIENLLQEIEDSLPNLKPGEKIVLPLSDGSKRIYENSDGEGFAHLTAANEDDQLCEDEFQYDPYIPPIRDFSEKRSLRHDPYLRDELRDEMKRELQQIMDATDEFLRNLGMDQRLFSNIQDRRAEINKTGEDLANLLKGLK